ncbi:MAG: hypothetical protein ACHQYO_06075 [Halanaerobiales bacterium]
MGLLKYRLLFINPVEIQKEFLQGFIFCDIYHGFSAGEMLLFI